jgi:hypothetical protein
MSQNDQRNTTAGIPDWKCERFVLNELDESEMDGIRRAADEDERLSARLEALERSNREILAKYPPGWMGGQIRERLGSDSTATRAARRDWRFRLPRMTLVPAGVVAVIAIALFVRPNLIPTGDLNGPEVTRIKGDSPQIRLYRRTESGSEQLRDGDLAAEHDLILLRYQTDDQGYGAILSVDGRGIITRHLPESGSQAAELEPQRSQLLGYAYELDDAPGWEVFAFVTSSSPFPIDSVVRAIEKSLSFSRIDSVSGTYLEVPQSLSFPEVFRVSTFTLIKDSRHED